jgi:hypothetical protein
MSQKYSSYKVNTFNQELIHCAALAFFIKKPKSSDQDFFDYIENEFFNGEDTDKILDLVGAEYDKKTHLGVFNTTSKSGISWVNSSIKIAKHLIDKLKLTDDYKIYHQKSKFGRLIKDKCIERIVEDLDLSKYSDEPDVYNPTDIWIVRENQRKNIERRLEEKIIEAPPGMVTRNYMANKHTYKSIIGSFFRTKHLYQISLKKAQPSGQVNYKIIGSVYGIPAQDIDPYTKFISIYDDLLKENNEQKLKEFISDLVLLRRVNYTDEVRQPNVTFTLRYGQLDITNQILSENENWKLDTPGNTFNMQKIGGTSWSGGLNFNGIHLALKNYSDYIPIFSEMQNLRYETFKELYEQLFVGEKVPQNIKNILLHKDEIIYKENDLNEIKKALKNEPNYKLFLVEAIKKLSGPYRGQKSLYGIKSTGSMDIQTSIKSESGIVSIVNKLKDGQSAIALSINPIKKGDKVISYIDKVDYKHITKRGSSLNTIKVNDVVFIRKIGKGGNETSASDIKTRVKKINIRKKTIELTKPITSGSADNIVAIIFNPVQANILSDQKLISFKAEILEEKFFKLQPFWMFMRGGPKKLREFIKKQIVLTIYGMVSKKGGKIFETNNKTIGSKIATKSAIDKYIIPQFIIVGN